MKKKNQSALDFLHTKCKMIHNNMTMSSIFLNEKGINSLLI